ncbi:MAG: YvbH-like oligomerization domain-containing protein, partial [Catalinimonas sp.]
AMSLLAKSNDGKLSDALTSLDKAVQVLADDRAGSKAKSDELPTLVAYINKWVYDAREQYVKKDFTDIFQKYINN